MKLPERVQPRFMVNRAKDPMARKTLSMRHIKEILRLKHQKKLSVREIGVTHHDIHGSSFQIVDGLGDKINP